MTSRVFVLAAFVNLEKAKASKFEDDEDDNVEEEEEVSSSSSVVMVEEEEEERLLLVDDDRIPPNYNNIKIFSVDMSSRVAFGRCVLQESISFDTLAQKIEASKLVLVDDQQRIRGYYDPKELVEIDRLNTELYILLNE